MKRTILYLCLLPLLFSCSGRKDIRHEGNCAYARYFDLQDDKIIIISPYDACRDTFEVAVPLNRIACLSTSHIACLAAVGRSDAVCAVSGAAYISNDRVRSSAADIRGDGTLDYERLLASAPELLVTFTVSSFEPPYIAKLRSLGIPVLVIHDHLEDHPLARAEYIRLFGALTGKRAEADSVFAAVAAGYERLAAEVSESAAGTAAVLMNIPFGDQWYVPGADGYMSRLISDAGGEVLGEQPGSASSVISVEKAYELSQKADFWFHTGYCSTMEQLEGAHPLFSDFPVAVRGRVWNNTARLTPGGGNDFWESGVTHPDIVLRDIVSILHPEVTGTADSLHYYIEVE